MLLVTNGAQKSGSTWLLHIALQIRPFEAVPPEYRATADDADARYTFDSLQFHRLLADPRGTTQDIIVKSHIRDIANRRLLLSTPHVRVIDIERDIRDVAVSFYYHWVRLGKFNGSFADFYWSRRHIWIWPVLKHRCVWDIRAANFLLLNYEQLLSDFPASVARLARFLDVSLTPAQIETIRDTTSPTSVAKKHAFGEMNRFRKGVSGDWQTHFDAAMLDDIRALQRRIQHPLTRLALRGPLWLRKRLDRFGRMPRRRLP